MKTNQKIYLPWLMIEVALTIVCALYFLISGQELVSNNYSLSWFNLCWLQLVMLLLLVVALIKVRSATWQVWQKRAIFLGLPIIIDRYWGSAFGHLSQQSSYWLILYAILIIQFLIPIIAYTADAINGTIWQILSVYWLIFSIMISSSFARVSPDWAYELINLGVLHAISFFLAAICLSKSWRLKLQLGSSLSKNEFVQPVPLVLLLLVSLWLSGFAACIYFSLTPGQAILLQPLAGGLHLQADDWMTAIEAGLLEQTEQALVLLILLAAFRQHKHQLGLSIGLTSLIFSLTHLINLASGEPINNVIGQVISTFGLAGFWLVLWLSTGQLWLAMVLHSLTDLLGFGLSGISFLANYGDPSIWGGLIISLTALLLALIFFIPERKTIHHHVNQLLNA
ncbi:MAG: hypothetical protein LKF01_06305 [Lactobacillus sp.]|jgi:hypothetical protein|nr:hypothetical protein [Lactobacillus sp.]MCH3906220.1 hypothetical protein [Lactobacillus sp.]MCH3990201.1 hypothetical protein [Lactobacillus sp.]MCH4069085.1 hypothetical protein [Lactobacillus sp.]MCI1303928.1 hypothetical protein [Lactobacillus sp.]